MYYRNNKKQNFDRLILNSVNNSHILTNEVYYDKTYKQQLINELTNRNIYEKFIKRELQEDKYGRTKMCSVASSSRLCFLLFGNTNGIIFESPLTTEHSSAQLDASLDNTFYECKCHEIFDSHDHLSLAYKNDLNKYFGINNIKENKNYCDLFLSDFGLNGNNSIYKLHFDVKQFLCHLFGLAHNDGGILQYIFFTPKEALISQNLFCKQIYDELKTEINMFWNESPKIKKMINTYKIELPKPQMIDVSTIDDFVMNKL